MCGSDIFLGLIAILFPPLAVWVKKGVCSADSLINIALCCLGFLPGLIHAWYIIAANPEPTYEELAQQDPERGNITYYYVRGAPQGQPPRRAAPPQGYGAVDSTPNAQFPPSRGGIVLPPETQTSAGPSDEVPPTYQQAMGDHKRQGP